MPNMKLRSNFLSDFPQFSVWVARKKGTLFREIYLSGAMIVVYHFFSCFVSKSRKTCFSSLHSNLAPTLFYQQRFQCSMKPHVVPSHGFAQSSRHKGKFIDKSYIESMQFISFRLSAQWNKLRSYFNRSTHSSNTNNKSRWCVIKHCDSFDQETLSSPLYIFFCDQNTS